MMHKVGLLALSLAIVFSCKVRTEDEQIAALLEAPFTDTQVGEAIVDPVASCLANGGEMLAGHCVCEDGNVIKGKTCSQHIKETYPKCFAKGGIAKKWDDKDACFCEHGEMIDINGAKTCYQLFSEKNKGCSDRLGIQEVSSRACKCYHGKLTFSLPPEVNCQEDFKTINPTCFAKGGVTKTENGPCICRDGSYAEGDVKCPEKWFFYQDATVTSNGPSAGNIIGTALPKCMCADVPFQGKNYCMIYKPGEKYPIKYLEVKEGVKCDITSCYMHFFEAFTTECGNDVKFKPDPALGSTAPGAAGCTCTETNFNNSRACGLFQGGQRRFAIQVQPSTTCDAQFCQNRWGHDPYVRQYCSSVN